MKRRRKGKEAGLKPRTDQKRTKNGNWLLYVGLGIFLSGLIYLVAPINNPEQGNNRTNFLRNGFLELECGAEYDDDSVDQCSPPPYCMRKIIDDFISGEEVEAFIEMAETGMKFGGGSGPPTILDLASGALSKGQRFIDLWQLMAEASETSNKFKYAQLVLVQDLVERLHRLFESEFSLPGDKIGLTQPFFFSRIEGLKSAKNMHDEYWHSHIDKLQYGSFIFSAVLYLNDQGKDYEGGRFVFVDGSHETPVEPVAGRLVAFSSGSENVHYVEPVKAGTRYAMIMAFTCDQNSMVTDFLQDRMHQLNLSP